MLAFFRFIKFYNEGEITMVSVRKRGKVYEYRFEIALTNIGEISYEVLEGLNYRAARLAQIPDEQYREMFRKYASSKTKTPQEAERLLDRNVERKKSITKKVDLLKQDMYQKSSGKVKGTDEYMFTDNIAQKNTPVKSPYKRQEVIDIVTGKAFQRQAQTPWTSNEKEELMKQIQDLRRAQFHKELNKWVWVKSKFQILMIYFNNKKGNNKLSNNKWKKKKWNMVCQCN